jgi:hypothetical protein
MIRKSLCLLVLAGSPAAALAADREISLELGTTGHAAEDNWFLFSGQDTLPGFGARLGWPVHERVAVIAGWQHGARGTTVSPGDDGAGEFAAAYYADAWSAGAKADWGICRWFRPYATVQAVGQRATVRLDDDTGEDDNPNQIQRSDFAVGGLAAGGLDFRVPFAQDRFAVASYLELGYQLLTPSDFDELGSLQNRGLAFRWGLGFRF